MIVSVASGKGGTGKTTVAVSLALSLPDAQLLDCDVEEPNAALFLNPSITEKEDACLPVPVADEEKCTYCGKCRDVCAYNAIAVLPASGETKGQILIFPNLCHGCGACAYLCPEKALSEINRSTGEVEEGHVEGLAFAQGRLNIGEAMAPPVIRQVKKRIIPGKTVIIDAPPGTSCPVITAVRGTDFCVLVTEPTPFGLNDLQLAVEAIRKLKIPFGVIINRHGMGDRQTENYCKQEDIPILMKIPFSEKIAKGYSRGEALIKTLPEYKERFLELADNIKYLLGKA